VTENLFARVRKFCIDFPDRADALHYHDWLIYLLARAWKLSWYFDPIPWMHYRQHDGNEIGSRGGWQAISKRLKLIASGWYRSQVQAAVDIFLCENNSDHTINFFAKYFAQKDSLSRRFALASFFLRNGRRKLPDRIVMAAFATIGRI
jgi:rhamnosyltransferase